VALGRIGHFEKSVSFDWRRVPARLPENEREVVLQELIDDALSYAQREYALQARSEFEAVFRNTRPHFEEIFKAGELQALAEGALRALRGEEVASACCAVLGSNEP
jgi:hypothetical protein